jgi:rRNA maturation RNase YbeY
VRDRVQAIQNIKRIYDAAQIAPQSVSVNFVSDDEISTLNLQWRGKDKPTDVLSFSAQEGGVMPGLEDVLGDIVISVDRAAAQAHEHGHALHDEIAVLFTHGLAHLLGFDHERSEDDAQKQLQFEMQLLEQAGLKPELALLGRELGVHV